MCSTLLLILTTCFCFQLLRIGSWDVWSFCSFYLFIFGCFGSSCRECWTEDGLDSTVSEAATLPWGSGPQPSAPFPDPPGWRNIEPEPPESEPPTKLEELPEDEASLLPEKAARAFVPIDLQCIERRPQEDLVVCCEASEGERRRTFLPPRATHPEPPECKWAEAVVKPPGHSCRGCGVWPQWEPPSSSSPACSTGRTPSCPSMPHACRP